MFKDEIEILKGDLINRPINFSEIRVVDDVEGCDVTIKDSPLEMIVLDEFYRIHIVGTMTSAGGDTIDCGNRIDVLKVLLTLLN